MVTLRKNGKVRMCVDYREPNKAVVMDSHQLPHMDDIFSEMRRATVFSTTDLAKSLSSGVTGRGELRHNCIHNA